MPSKPNPSYGSLKFTKSCERLEQYLEDQGLPPPHYKITSETKHAHGSVYTLYRCDLTLPGYPYTAKSARQSTKNLAKGHAAYLGYSSHRNVSGQAKERIKKRNKQYLPTQPGGLDPGEEEQDKVFEYNGAPLAFHVPGHNKLTNGGILVEEEDAVFLILDGTASQPARPQADLELLERIKSRYSDRPIVAVSRPAKKVRFSLPPSKPPLPTFTEVVERKRSDLIPKQARPTKVPPVVAGPQSARGGAAGTETTKEKEAVVKVEKTDPASPPAKSEPKGSTIKKAGRAPDEPVKKNVKRERC
ncbi:uncharacterized protein LOC62_04G006179 [Vanrija pseudolonga]|uniref:Uncharacterized protein n=1 Tax=Vanrija pseudolonga TaxID=143232 RepID=A0AAF1BLW0_9TREE|nr:hypothetical protein LOC62_04G006179 [Vanrija pseudolonga]